MANNKNKKIKLVCNPANNEEGSATRNRSEDKVVCKPINNDEGSATRSRSEDESVEDRPVLKRLKRERTESDSAETAQSEDNLATEDIVENKDNEIVSLSESVRDSVRDDSSLPLVVVDPVTSKTLSSPSNVMTTRTSGATFAAVFGKKKAEDKKNEYEGPYLEDFDILRVQKLPQECQVTKDSLQDECLADSYKNLPPLETGMFISWKPSAVGRGQAVFSRLWPASIPDMRIWNCMDAIQFVRSGRFINPSRVSPLVVNARRMSPDGRNLRLYVDAVHSICVSSICVTESFLHSPPSTGLAQKQLRGVLHTQEWERLTAFFCMVFFKPELNAQLYKDSLSFTTKTSDFSLSGSSSMFKQSSERNKSSNATGDTFVLDYVTSIPVYDARSTDFNMAEDITHLKDELPLFEEEIPKGSFAVVGYTASCYHSSKDGLWHFSGNIQWVVIMGNPTVA